MILCFFPVRHFKRSIISFLLDGQEKATGYHRRKSRSVLKDGLYKEIPSVYKIPQPFVKINKNLFLLSVCFVHLHIASSMNYCSASMLRYTGKVLTCVVFL